jgi:hypothetical protein
MGHLFYGDSGAGVDVPDRALAHLQIVIITKLRRGESFAFSWIEPVSSGSGRSTIWLHPMATLRFVFAGNRTPAINSVWLEQLTELANSNGGLHCTTEPSDTPPSDVLPGWHRTATVTAAPLSTARSSYRA